MVIEGKGLQYGMIEFEMREQVMGSLKMMSKGYDCLVCVEEELKSFLVERET